MTDNPHVFPCEEWRNTSSDPLATPRVFHHPGMTLRDYFAGQALSGLIAAYLDTPAKVVELSGGVTGGKYIVGSAYRLADAMLAARPKEQGNV